MVMVPYGLPLNIGWTIGEEILFKPENEQGVSMRSDVCKAYTEAGVLGIEKKNLNLLK